MLKFLASNLVNDATLTASTANASYPVSNLKVDFRTKTWRSTSNSDNVVFDLGATEDVDAVGIVDNWRNGFGVTSVTVEANGTDSWGAPAFSTTITLDSTFGVGIKELSSTQSYRFWRFVFTSTLGYCEVANVFIGKKVDITTNGINYNYSYRNRDLKKTASTEYGQEFIDDIGTRKELSTLTVSVMSLAEIDQIFSVYDAVRTVKPLYITFGSTTSVLNDVDRLNGIYKFTSEPRFTHQTAGFWNVTFSLREQK